MLSNYVDVSDVGDPVSINPVDIDAGDPVPTHVNISDAGDPVFNNNDNILDTGYSVLSDDAINIISDDVDFINVDISSEETTTTNISPSPTNTNNTQPTHLTLPTLPVPPGAPPGGAGGTVSTGRTSTIASKSKLKCTLINSRSLCNKMQDMISYVYENNPDMIFTTET